ncbi:MAG: hypothetical protein SAK29_15065 [Scytonema sp. PMC 1069.18]|nr:hypothetical protein [Scytonema sp. PMC 1069.18]MEC4882904.1 hypothetical protein [Scytonema sp. PMC 1070.18]
MPYFFPKLVETQLFAVWVPCLPVTKDNNFAALNRQHLATVKRSPDSRRC